MTEAPTCPRPGCGRPIHDMAYVDGRCGDQLRRDLELVAKLAGEAATTVARMDRIGHGGQRTDTEVPLPVNLGAAADHDAAVNTLTTWARHVHGESGRPLPTVHTRPWCVHDSCNQRRIGRYIGPACDALNPPDHPTAITARWLAEQVDWIRHRPEADEAFDELADACSLIVRVVDRPAERWYAGPCACGGELWPAAGKATARCPECGTVHDLAARKVAMLDQLEEVWATAALCAHALVSLGVAANASTIRVWANRGRLAPHPEGAVGHPRYRIGSVRELIVEHEHDERMRRLERAVKDAERAERARKKAPDDERISA